MVTLILQKIKQTLREIVSQIVLVLVNGCNSFVKYDFKQFN